MGISNKVLTEMSDEGLQTMKDDAQSDIHTCKSQIAFIEGKVEAASETLRAINVELMIREGR